MIKIISKGYKKKRLLSTLSLFFVIGFFPSSIFAVNKTIKTEDVLITFKTDVIDPQVLTAIQEHQGKIIWKPDEIRSISATIPIPFIDDLKEYSSIKYIEKDTTMKIKTQIQDWGITKVNAPASWNLGYTGKGTKIAIIDTGISPHEDLHISGGISTVPYTSSYQDDQGHGTHLAGIIGAKNNFIGTIGVAPDSKIYAVKAVGSDGNGLVSDIIEGIDWAISNDMDIINMSMGTPTESLALKDAILRATNKGIIVVVAAGNEGNEKGTGNTVNYPARYENVISVAAVDQANKRAHFSSTGPTVDVAAPGVGIISTYNNGSFVQADGTSMAAPYVTGVIALYKEAYPNYTSSQIQNLLKKNVIDLGTPGKDYHFGLGLVQAPKVRNTTVTPALGTITSFTLKPSDTSVQISWAKVSNATSYQVKRNGTLVYNGSLLNFKDTKLTSGKKYTYELTALSKSGQKTKLSKETTTTAPSSSEKTYTLVKGDTLYKIAKKNKTTVSALKSLNKLKSDSIKIGQKLIVSKEAKSTPPTPKPKETPKSSVKTKTYTVVKGDTLYKIATKNKISVSTLKSMNKLKSDSIKVGQKLIVSKK